MEILILKWFKEAKSQLNQRDSKLIEETEEKYPRYYKKIYKNHMGGDPMKDKHKISFNITEYYEKRNIPNLEWDRKDMDKMFITAFLPSELTINLEVKKPYNQENFSKLFIQEFDKNNIFESKMIIVEELGFQRFSIRFYENKVEEFATFNLNMDYDRLKIEWFNKIINNYINYINNQTDFLYKKEITYC